MAQLKMQERKLKREVLSKEEKILAQKEVLAKIRQSHRVEVISDDEDLQRVQDPCMPSTGDIAMHGSYPPPAQIKLKQIVIDATDTEMELQEVMKEIEQVEREIYNNDGSRNLGARSSFR